MNCVNKRALHYLLHAFKVHINDIMRNTCAIYCREGNKVMAFVKVLNVPNDEYCDSRLVMG